MVSTGDFCSFPGRLFLFQYGAASRCVAPKKIEVSGGDAGGSRSSDWLRATVTPGEWRFVGVVVQSTETVSVLVAAAVLSVANVKVS